MIWFRFQQAEDEFGSAGGVGVSPDAVTLPLGPRACVRRPVRPGHGAVAPWQAVADVATVPDPTFGVVERVQNLFLDNPRFGACNEKSKSTIKC